MNRELLGRWLQQDDDELVDFVEETPWDIGDIESDDLIREGNQNACPGSV